MALKDLTLAKAQLTEKQIEELVADYVRYDVDDKSIILMPQAAHLPNRCKVLVYLTAIQGWPFVSHEAVPTDSTPAQIEEALNIPGGTLRPLLKDLKESHLIAVHGRTYSIKTAALSTIRGEIQRYGGKQAEIPHAGQRLSPSA